MVFRRLTPEISSHFTTPLIGFKKRLPTPFPLPDLRLYLQRCLITDDPGQGLDQLVHRGVGPGRRAMARGARGGQLQPEGGLLGGFHAVVADFAIVAHGDEVVLIQNGARVLQEVETKDSRPLFRSILGQGFGVFVYLRNLYFVMRDRKAGPAAT